MNKGKVLSFRNCNNFLRIISDNSFLIIFTVIFVLGLIFGVIFCGKYDFLSNYFNEFLNEFIAYRESNTVLKVTVKSFFTFLLVFCFTFSFGASLSGIFFIPLFLFLNGYAFGMISSMLYSQYSLKGVAFHTVILLPSAIIFVIAHIFSCIESVKFSLTVAKLTLPSTMPQNLSLYFRDYCIKYILYIFLTFISALADALISVNFIKNFSLQ